MLLAPGSAGFLPNAEFRQVPFLAGSSLEFPARTAFGDLDLIDKDVLDVLDRSRVDVNGAKMQRCLSVADQVF